MNNAMIRKQPVEHRQVSGFPHKWVLMSHMGSSRLDFLCVQCKCGVSLPLGSDDPDLDQFGICQGDE